MTPIIFMDKMSSLLTHFNSALGCMRLLQLALLKAIDFEISKLTRLFLQLHLFDWSIIQFTGGAINSQIIIYSCKFSMC